MEIKKLEAAIEAVLFTMGESVELSQIAGAIQQDKETTRKIIHNMMDRYQAEERGIQIIELEQSYQMCTKKEYYECLIRLALHAGNALDHCVQAAGHKGRDRENPRCKMRPCNQQADGV